MNHLVFKAVLALAIDAEGGVGAPCRDNAFPPCFSFRDGVVYALLLALIGLFAGLVSKRNMPEGEETGYPTNYILGLIGSFIGGLSWLAHRWMSWNTTKIPEGSLYTNVGSYNLLPGYLLSLLAAAMTALLLIALYRLLRGLESEDES
jgi:uncharacterized membrane protein YeaQ/YmgE (transglycosylase-associated protein family)